MAHELRVACLFFKWLKKKIKERTNATWKLHKIQVSLPINKVLLEHGHLFMGYMFVAIALQQQN